MHYLDTSVVLSYYLPESLSDAAQAIYRERQDLVLSDWTDLETTSVIARLARAGSLQVEDPRATLELVRAHVGAGLYRRVATGPEHIEGARRLIADLAVPLRAPDALHVTLAHGHGSRS